jgi:hypothetical protein
MRYRWANLARTLIEVHADAADLVVIPASQAPAGVAIEEPEDGSRAERVRLAQLELDRTDYIVVRSQERGEPIDPAFHARREELRAIISNRDVAPAQPHQTGGDQGGASALSPAAAPPAYPGTMITENERATLTGLLLGQIARYAKERIEARYDANARHGIAQTMSDYTNKVALQLPVSDAERDAFDDAQAADRWIGATQAFRDQLFGSLADLPINMLQHYVVEGAPWP